MIKYYHVTVLNNFLIGFDKYKKTYDKSSIRKSSYPEFFFLLSQDNIQVGVEKATKLIHKLAIPENRLIVLETEIDPRLVLNNDITSTRLGEYIKSSEIRVNKVYYWEDGRLIESRIEDMVAASYKVSQINKQSYSNLMPRSLSFLPVAKGCQAKCAFCFSASSISTEQKQGVISESVMHSALKKASRAGATRAVITGGGEPCLLSVEKLGNIIRVCNEYFSKTVLITNGYSLVIDNDISRTLNYFEESGLSVLSVSRHHYDRAKNCQLMSLDIDSEVIARTLINDKSSLILRWVCVLQKGGIDSSAKLQKYIDWTFEQRVAQICFKELYVSSNSESVYFNQAANDWSYKNQVPLSIVIDMAEQQEWELVEKLPWGSPVYRVSRGKQSITIAAYTEPSVSWELTNKQCRSWNVMSNGECFASLESKDSIIDIEDIA